MGRKTRRKPEHRPAVERRGRTAHPPAPRTRLGDVRWGIGWGLAMGVGVLVMAALAVGIVTLVGAAPFDRRLLPAIVYYPVVGALGGAIVGLLRSFAGRSRGGATLTGMLAALPAGLGGAWLLRDTADGGPASLLGTALVGSALLGGIVGRRMWTMEQHRDPGPPHLPNRT